MATIDTEAARTPSQGNIGGGRLAGGGSVREQLISSGAESITKLILTSMEGARRSRMGQAVIDLGAKLAIARVNNLGNTERKEIKRKFVSGLAEGGMNPADAVEVGKLVEVQKLQQIRIDARRTGQITPQGDIVSIGGEIPGGGDYSQGVDLFGNELKKLNGTAPNTVAAYKTFIENNINEIKHRGLKQQFEISFMLAKNNLTKFLAERDAFKIFGQGRKLVIASDINAEKLAKLNEFSRHVSEVRQQITSSSITEFANDSDNTLSKSSIQGLWKALRLDITNKLTRNVVDELGVNFKTLNDILNDEETLVNTFAENVFKMGPLGSATEKHETLSNLLRAQQFIATNEFRSQLPPDIQKIILQRESGFLDAVVKIAEVAQIIGDTTTVEQVIKELVLPTAERFAEQSISYLEDPRKFANEKGEVFLEKILQEIRAVRNNQAMIRSPNLVIRFEIAMNRLVEQLENQGEGRAAKQLQNEFNKFNTANEKKRIIVNERVGSLGGG